MSQALAPSACASVVPAEWRGQARLFLRRIANSKTTDVTAASRAAFAPLKERVERNHMPTLQTHVESMRTLGGSPCRHCGRLHVEVNLSARACDLIELQTDWLRAIRKPHGSTATTPARC